MQLIRYYNRYSWTYYSYYGYCCDYISSYWRYSSWYCSYYYQCDNYFDICVRSYGSTTATSSSSTCTYGRKTTPVAGDDSFSFSSTSIGSGSSAIDNPIVISYTGTTSPVSLCGELCMCKATEFHNGFYHLPRSTTTSFFLGRMMRMVHTIPPLTTATTITTSPPRTITTTHTFMGAMQVRTFTSTSVTSGTAQPTTTAPTAPGTASTRTTTTGTTAVTLMATLSALMAGLEPPPTAKLVSSSSS